MNHHLEKINVMQLVSCNDQQLVELYLQGNENAFAELLRRHKSKMFTSIVLFVKDHALAEDIFQEVCIKIIETLRKGKYQNEGKFIQWAMRISHNLCVDYFRRNKRRPTFNATDEFDIFDVLKHSDAGPEQQLEQRQVYDRIRQLVDMLPDEQREVVILRHYADLSFKDIAALTRVSINTALGRMRYALINIRRMVEEKEIVLL
jgi:RNA polymerase sigma-70 factor (ECF subfamily)